MLLLLANFPTSFLYNLMANTAVEVQFWIPIGCWLLLTVHLGKLHSRIVFTFIIFHLFISFRQSASSFTVISGIYHLSQSGNKHRVERIVQHPSYTQQNNFNDIALIRVSDPFIGPNVASITLRSTHNANGGEVATLCGWGLTSYPGAVSPQLNWIRLNTIDLGTCAANLNPLQVSSGAVCTWMASGLGACQGDSGGPLTVGSEQVGVVSWGIPCANGKPDVFTSVGFYYTWIQNNMY